MKKNSIHDRINKKWLRFAEEDYNLIIYLWNTENRFYRSICFHAQQFIEKVLKGVLDGEGLSLPRIHDINTLVKMVSPGKVMLKLLLRL